MVLIGNCTSQLWSTCAQDREYNIEFCYIDYPYPLLPLLIGSPLFISSSLLPPFPERERGLAVSIETVSNCSTSLAGSLTLTRLRLNYIPLGDNFLTDYPACIAAPPAANRTQHKEPCWGEEREREGKKHQRNSHQLTNVTAINAFATGAIKMEEGRDNIGPQASSWIYCFDGRNLMGKINRLYWIPLGPPFSMPPLSLYSLSVAGLQ